jgi:hypothetical protein
MTSKGIIVGSNRAQEWLLPWWWLHYHLYNSYPVSFVNFGDMSKKALDWCKERGEVFSIPHSDEFIVKKGKVDVSKADLWEKIHPDLWNVRLGWFKKPFALALTPYKKTIWIDLDCQIQGNLAPLFDLDLMECKLTLAPEADWSQELNRLRQMIKPPQLVLNSGVIVYEKESPILQQWIEEVQKNNAEHYGDQQALIKCIYESHLSFRPMNRLFNWTVDLGLNPEALILHWWGIKKEEIQKQIQLSKNLLNIKLEL